MTPAALAGRNTFTLRGNMNEQPEHLTGTEARAGNRNPVNRVVLGVSLVLIVVIFAVILFVAR